MEEFVEWLQTIVDIGFFWSYFLTALVLGEVRTPVWSVEDGSAEAHLCFQSRPTTHGRKPEKQFKDSSVL